MQVGEGRKAGICDPGLSRSYVRRCQIEQMHDAQMHLAYRGRVIVDQPEHQLAKRSTQIDFLRQFPQHTGPIRIGGCAILGGTDMSADTHRPSGTQSRFASAGSASVVEQRIATAEHHVGYQLLERWVMFGLRARSVAEMSGIEQTCEVVGFECSKSLERAHATQPVRWDTQDTFSG